MTEWPPHLREALETAGFFAAHALWCVEDGDVLVPFVVNEFADEKREIIRFESEDNIESVSRARTYMATNTAGALRATLVFDGYITLPEGKTDGLFVEGLVFTLLRASLSMVVPYRNAASPEGLAVYRPKFLVLPHDAPEISLLAEAFFAGVDRHEKGSAVWSRHIDQSR